MHVALVLFLLLQHYLNCRVVLPLAQLPLHLYVLSWSQREESTLNLVFKDREFAALVGLYLCLCTRALHDLPE